jgi:hypothetical protein
MRVVAVSTDDSANRFEHNTYACFLTLRFLPRVPTNGLHFFCRATPAGLACVHADDAERMKQRRRPAIAFNL